MIDKRFSLVEMWFI